MEKLIHEFVSEVSIGMHSVEAEYNRSFTKQKLLNLGLCTLNEIATYMSKKFTTSENKERNFNLEITFIWLLDEIAVTNRLEVPYGSTVQIGDMKISEWIKFAEENYEYREICNDCDGTGDASNYIPGGLTFCSNCGCHGCLES